jgi:hypothetical protein
MFYLVINICMNATFWNLWLWKFIKDTWLDSNFVNQWKKKTYLSAKGLPPKHTFSIFTKRYSLHLRLSLHAFRVHKYVGENVRTCLLELVNAVLPAWKFYWICFFLWPTDWTTRWYFAMPSGVTRWVCENVAQNVAQPIFLSKLIHNYYRGKKLHKNLDYFSNS